jgi:hypothetical protein
MSGSGNVPSSGGTSAAGSGATSGAARAPSGAAGTGAPGGTAGSGGAGAKSGAGAGGTLTGGAGGTLTVAGSGGGGSGGGGNAGGGNAGGCTRELLKTTTQAYFKALAAHDPSMLPLADTAKFTENGKSMKIGEGGLWKTAGEVKYSQSMLDTQECQAVSQAVVPDGSKDIPFGLRLKLENQKLTEVETIAVRQGDYAAVASDTQAIIKANDSVRWEEPVPAAQRATRQEITGWMDKYFRMFPSGVCNVTSACRRLENGGGNFMCSLGASCAAGEPSPGQAELDPRLILADVETGIGVGFTMFQTNTDMHMFKMYDKQVHAVHTILGKAGSSGW